MSATTLPDQLSAPARTFAGHDQQLLIGGERVPAADGATFETLDPATGRVITTVAQAGAPDVDRAVAAARTAFADSDWSRASAADRGRLIGRFAELVEANGDELAELESLDNGKPLKLAKVVDLAGTVAHLRSFAGWPERIFGTTIPVRQPDMHVYTRKEPVGVCVQIIPWNFPMLMAAWKLGPALAAGCTVVPKPAEQTPLTALRLGELALEAGHARARRQVTEHHPPRRRTERRDRRLVQRDLLQLRPSLQRRQPPVHPARAVRRGRLRPRRTRRQDARRTRPREGHATRPGRLPGAARSGHGVHRVRSRRGRRTRHRWRIARFW
jgi:hypothetical protein